MLWSLSVVAGHLHPPKWSASITPERIIIITVVTVQSDVICKVLRMDFSLSNHSLCKIFNLP